jgi:hypothetical protein
LDYCYDLALLWNQRKEIEMMNNSLPDLERFGELYSLCVVQKLGNADQQTELQNLRSKLSNTDTLKQKIEKHIAETLPNKIRRLKDAIFVKGLVNDKKQKKQILELIGSYKALEWEIENLKSLLESEK